MPRTNKFKSNYKPSYKWGGNTTLWASETEQKIIQKSQNNIENKPKEDLVDEINYGKRINYWH